jgi:hypothetical protein
MSGVRVLVGTRKGAFLLTSDGKRRRWDVSGPLFAGWEVYHVKGSPADPNRLYASQTSGWFGQIVQRSNDGGRTWHQPGTPAGEPTTTPDGMPKGESNKFVYDTSSETGKPLTTHQWYDGSQRPWEFKRVWHLEPSLTDPDTVYAFGFVIEVHAHEPETIYVVPIKSDSEHFPPEGRLRVYRSRSGGNEWEALTEGLPQRDCYVNVLRDAMTIDSLDPCGVYFGTTGGQVYASADAGQSWAPIVRDLPAVLSVEAQTLP